MRRTTIVASRRWWSKGACDVGSKSIIGAAALCLIAASSGCSLFLETSRPEYTDVSAVHQGMARADVSAAMGKPVQTYQKDGKDVEVFQVDPDGRLAGTKVAVNTFNAAADIFTLGMWEVVATPAELLSQHKLTNYVVTYSTDQKVMSIETQ